MARKVYNTKMVCHLWAQQDPKITEARNSGGTVYFRDSAIFSYGDHFPMAKWYAKRVRGSQGPMGIARIVLVNSGHYSVTTSHHMGAVLAAIPNVVVTIAVPHVILPDHRNDAVSQHRENLKYFDDAIIVMAKKVARARVSGEWLLKSLNGLIEDANTYSQFFGLRRKFRSPLDDPKVIEEILERTKRQEAKDRYKLKKKAKAHMAGFRSAVEEWRQHHRGNLPYTPADISRVLTEEERHELAAVRLRLERRVGLAADAERQNIETSLGATFPLTHGKRILGMVRKGLTYKHNGHSLHAGTFVVDEITEDGTVKAGCHTVTREEMELLAKEIGV